MDKRIIKTETSIKKAYLRLLAQKDADEIRTSDITDEAQVNRTTFYLHYGSAADVWEEIEKDISDSAYACMEKHGSSDVGGCLQEIFSSLTKEIDENKTAPALAAGMPNSERVANGFRTALTDGIFRFMTDGAPQGDTGKYMYACTCVCSGATDAYIRWLSRRDVTPDEFCGVIGSAAAFLEDPRT